MGWVTAVLGILDRVVPFVDLAEGANQRRHELKMKKHEVQLRTLEQSEVIRKGPLDEITFIIFFYPWVALWIPYDPINQHAITALQRIGDAPEIMLWPALLIVARIWGVAVESIPAMLWKKK